MSLIFQKHHSDYEFHIEHNDYWVGQMIPLLKAEREDADYHYMSWDMDLDK